MKTNSTPPPKKKRKKKPKRKKTTKIEYLYRQRIYACISSIRFLRFYTGKVNFIYGKLSYSDLKQNKGSILKASVEYMKELKRDKYKLHKLEENQAVMDSKYQKLLFRIFVSTCINSYQMTVSILKAF